ncbi:MAG: hypothetical protein K2O21_01600, partial [Malacoplasma sp.]|nr:hypothetical protein [Malacoplasma sp.]
IKNNKDNDVPNNFKDFLTKTLKTDVINFLKQIKFEAVLSTHTDSDEKTWNQNTGIPTYEQKKEFYNQISFNNNYSFYLNGVKKEKDKNINKLKSNKLNLFDVNSDSISLSENAKSADYFYKSFSTIEELYKVFNFDFSKNQTHTTTFFPIIMDVNWSPGPDLAFEINSENQTDEKKNFGNCLKILFGENFNKIELKNDTGISFWKQYFPSIQGNFIYYKILLSPGETTINFWQLSTGRNSVAPSGRDYSDKFIYDTYSRQVYFKFQNILYFETSDSSKKIESNGQLIDYFNEHMGINKDNINKNNEVYKRIMQKFLINYFGVNESYKISNLEKLPEYNDVIKLFEKGYKEIVENLKSRINKNLDISGGNGISDVKQTFSHYSQGTYVNENDETEKSKDTTIQKYTKGLINGLDEYIGDSIDETSVNKQISDWEKKSKKVITFNEKPLFVVNANSEKYSDWKLDQLENVSNRISILDKEKNSISIDLSSTKQKTWLDFSSWKTDFLNQLKNIDEDYRNVDFTTLLSGIINSTPDKNEKIGQLEYNPGIFSAFYYYEKNLNLFTNSEDKKYSNLLENVVNRIDNLSFTLDKFITLYANLKDIKVLDDNTFLNLLEPMYYGEYFGRITDFNESFDDIKLFYTNLKDKEEQLNKMNYFYPSQITYYVDKKGNVVSIDPVDDKINLASTPTQSMYDSPDLVTKNAYNNFVLTQNTNYVFYEEKNGEKTLLKNEVEFLYTLAINNNNIIFDEYNYAFSYLKQYIIANGKALN